MTKTHANIMNSFIKIKNDLKKLINVKKQEVINHNHKVDEITKTINAAKLEKTKAERTIEKLTEIIG